MINLTKGGVTTSKLQDRPKIIISPDSCQISDGKRWKAATDFCLFDGGQVSTRYSSASELESQGIKPMGFVEARLSFPLAII